MSEGSDALERAVSEYMEARAALDREGGARARVRTDRAFARLAALLAPRVRYFTRRYGLADAADDAQQVCAIAIHRATERYDPVRARFTTYVTWQIRAELQALRQRLRGGPRAATLSLDALVEAGADAWLADAEAEAATEAAASNRLAHRCADRLVRDWAVRRRALLMRPRAGLPVETRVEAEAALIRRQLVDTDSGGQRLSESERHIVRRALADIVQRAAA
jgi:RNA polymerase sigma-32 factor